MDLIKITKMFYEDHMDRDLLAPPVIKETTRHIFIDGSSEHLGELLSDASYYADPESFNAEFGSHLAALIRSARATKQAIEKAKRKSNTYNDTMEYLESRVSRIRANLKSGETQQCS